MEVNMTRLCIGTVFKILSLSKRGGISDKSLGEVIFGGPYGENLNDAAINRIKNCVRDITDKAKENFSQWETEEKLDMANDIITNCLDANLLKETVLALQATVVEDDTINSSTIIGFDCKYKKANIERMSEFNFTSFLANVISYTYINGHNAGNEEYSKKINKEFLKSFSEETSKIILVESVDKQQIDKRIKKRRYVDKKHPLRFNSNTTSLIGRKEEIEKISAFMTCNDTPDIQWMALIGVGGSGKSKLAHEIGLSLNYDYWNVYTIDKHIEYKYEQINEEIRLDEKNTLIILDNEAADNEPIARWLSHQYDVGLLGSIRILLCQRMPAYIAKDRKAPWFESIYDYDEISPYFCYKGNDDGFYITLNCLSENDLLMVSEEYFINTYGNKDINDSKEAIKHLYEIDPVFRRPLYLMMICEAILAGTIDKIHNEEELLDYVYRVELKRIRDKIKAVFGVSHTENTIIYDSVERDYANAIIRSYFGKSNEISNYILKYVDLPEEVVKQKCEDYGLCQDGIVPIIEPDLLGEYYVLRNIEKLGNFLCVADFWIKLIRDFNYLLLTKYKRGILNVARLNLAEFVTYFIQGIFEAYYTTNDIGERKRLRNLLETLFEQVYEWIPSDDIMFPMGKDGTISWIVFLSQGHLNDVLHKMDYIDEGNAGKIRKTSNNPYDILISNHARDIYIEMCKCLENDMNCHRIVNLLNKMAQLYEEEKQKIIELEADFRDIDRDTEIPLYLSRGIFITIIFIFGRGLEYEDEIASSLAKNGMSMLHNLHELMPGDEETLNYIKALMLLYLGDNHRFYKSENDVLDELEELKNSFYNVNDEFKAVFDAFLDDLNNGK